MSMPPPNWFFIHKKTLLSDFFRLFYHFLFIHSAHCVVEWLGFLIFQLHTKKNIFFKKIIAKKFLSLNSWKVLPKRSGTWQLFSMAFLYHPSSSSLILLLGYCCHEINKKSGKMDDKKNFLIVIIFRNESHDSSIFLVWNLMPFGGS